MRPIILFLLLMCSLPSMAQSNEPIIPVGPRHSLMGGLVPAGLGLQYQYRLLEVPGVQLWLGGSLGTTKYTFHSREGNYQDDYGFALSVTPSLLLGKKRGKLELSMSATAIGNRVTSLYGQWLTPQRSVMFSSAAELFYIGYRLQPLEGRGFTFMGGIGIATYGDSRDVPVLPSLRLGAGYSF